MCVFGHVGGKQRHSPSVLRRGQALDWQGGVFPAKRAGKVDASEHLGMPQRAGKGLAGRRDEHATQGRQQIGQVFFGLHNCGNVSENTSQRAGKVDARERWKRFRRFLGTPHQRTLETFRKIPRHATAPDRKFFQKRRTATLSKKVRGMRKSMRSICRSLSLLPPLYKILEGRKAGWERLRVPVPCLLL